MATTIADMLEAQDDLIEELTERVRALEANQAQILSLTVQVDQVLKLLQEREHGRTKTDSR